MKTKKGLIITDKEMDYVDAKAYAKGQGTTLPTVKDFILALRGKVKCGGLKGHWSWTADVGYNRSGYSKIDYENGTITKVSEKEWDKLDVSQRAYAWGGGGPVALYVDFNDDYYYWRLSVGAVSRPDGAARVVLKEGTAKPSKAVCPKCGQAIK